MKKIDFGAPPPPPPELPRPVPTELYSPTQYSGVQQYSPSRATSPGSEDEKPPPPTAASLPPRKVLGSDQAKRRLQAFAKSKLTNSPKGKVSAIFAEEEDEAVREKTEKKKGPMVKDSTPVMASIMKEETANRETIKKNIEKIKQKAGESDSDVRRKDDEGRRFIEENSDMDLRDLLKKKREVSETTNESSKGGWNRRSRSKEGVRGRTERRRVERSPRNSKKSSSANRDRSRKGRDSLSPERSIKDREESSGGKKRRGRERSRNRKSSVEDEDHRREEKSSNRKFKEESPISSDKIASAFGTFGSGKKDYNDESPSNEKFTEIVDGKSKRGGSRESSRNRRDNDASEVNRRRDLKRRSSADREGHRTRYISGNKKVDRRSPESGRKFSTERKTEKNFIAGDLKEEKSRAASQSRGNRSLGDLKDFRKQIKKDKDNNADHSWSEESHRKMNLSSDGKIIESRDQLYPTDKAKSDKQQSTKKDIDLWELKHGNQSLSTEKALKMSENDGKGGNFKDQVIYIRAASEDDYQEVKQEVRDISGFVHNKDGVFIEYPCKFIQETSSGISWSFNLEVCKNLDIEKKKSARIRKSIDSMVSELEHETMKKRSRENSVYSDKPEPMKKKKKKKSNKGEDMKKDKKKKKVKREDASNKKLKKKKKKRDKDMDLDEDIFLPDLSLDLDRSMTSTNASPDSKRRRVNSGGSSVPLSAAGMSKLFSMAGYDPSTKDKESRTDESGSKSQGVGSLSPSPLKSKKADISRIDRSPPCRSSSRHSNEQRTEKIMYEMPRRSLSERSPSPSLRGDLSRISGPRTPSPGPRLPKMKDSRSPSKVPIMRDRRSPLKRSPGRDAKFRDLGSEYKKSPEKFESPKKKDGRRTQKSREGSPIGQYMTEEDFIGRNYDGIVSKREEKGRFESPKSSQHSSSSRRVVKSPGRFVSPGPSPRGSISSHKSEEERLGSSNKRKASSPESRSLLEDSKYSKRTLDERSRSPIKASPGLVYNPINESRDYSPDQRRYDDGRKDRLERKLFSPGNNNSSPGRRLDSPERHPVSPDHRHRAESRAGREADKRYPSVGHTNQSPRRRSSISPKKSPAKRTRTPERSNISERTPRSPGRRQVDHSGSRERRQGISDRPTRSPNRRSRTPDRKPISHGRSPMGRTRSPQKSEYKAETRSSNHDSTSNSSGGRRLEDFDRRKEASPNGRRLDSPIGTRAASPRGRRMSSPGGRRQASPGRRKLESPDVRRQASPGGRRLASPSARRPSSPGGGRPASPGGRRPSSPGGRRLASPSAKRQFSPNGRRPSSPGGRRLASPGGRKPSSPRERRPISPSRRIPESPVGRRPGSPNVNRHGSPSRRPESPRRRPRSPPSGQSNVDRRAFSPERGYVRRPYSPEPRTRARSAEKMAHGHDHRMYSPDHRQKSPRDRRSPVLHSPGRRGLASPGRGRRPRTPPYSPGRRARTPESRRVSPDRDRRLHSPGRDRKPYSPDRDRRPRSPERRPHSPARRRFSPSYDPRDRSLPDSTISDADLARQMPPPSLHYKYKQFPPLASPANTGYSDSPKRLSLDERLEREHGIKIEHEQTPPMDFSRPPPGFPSVQPHYPPAMPPSGPPQHATPLPFSTGLPAMMPTYDDSAPPTPVKGPPYPGTQKVANEKEQAIIAAQAVASKLQEMQAAIEDERKKKKEQKMAERMAQMDAAKREEKVQESKIVPAKAATGRIFDEVEKQEIEMKEKDVKVENKDGEKKKHEEKRKKRKDKDSPLLITLKPFYRPNDRKDKKKRKVEVPEADLTDEEFVPRSPVPLPDNSSLKPVLIKPNQTKLKIISEGSSDKKGVKYADGVLPGQGSPDQDFSPPPPSTAGEKPVKKRYKKVTITVITQHVGDTDSEEEGPPPPPPGSPPRYHLKDLISMYGTPRPVGSSA